MIKYTNNILRQWQKGREQLVVNALGGIDDRSGHTVRVLMVSEYPPVILAGYLDQLDELVSREGATLRKTIRYAASDIRFNNGMKNKLDRLNKTLESHTDRDPARPEEIAARDTIVALRDATRYGNSKLIEVSTFLTLSAPKNYQLDAAEANIRQWFDHMSGALDKLHREQLEAMRQTSLAFDPETKSSLFFNKKHYGRVTTDGVAARTYPMTRGSFSDEEGIYFGRRTEDGGFCFINLCDPMDPRAQNITAFGKTGEGKSYFLKALAVSLLDEGIRVFVFDLDGEWRDLCAEVGGVYIDHTSEEGRYFEPLAIMPEIPELDEACVRYNRERLKKAQEGGLRAFSLLAEELSAAEVFEVGEAIRAVFTEAGIKREDMKTWMGPYTGERPTLHVAFRAIEARKEKHPHALTLYDKIKIYFIGIYDHMFRVEEPLAFQEAPFVVYKVGNGEKDGEGKNERAKQAQIKMSMAFDAVNAQIQKLRFEGAYFSAVFVDEGQRQMQNPELRRAIFDWYTSIRKWNGMMVLASNTPAIMLDTAEGIGMWENTSVRVFFYMDRSAVRALTNFADMPSEIQERISRNESTNHYVLEYHKKYDELYMHVPEREGKLYKTRGLREKGG